jgi:hypothetical protein
MPEGELLPKQKTYKAWMEYAENKRKAIEEYLNSGGKSGDETHRAMKANESMARTTALKYLDAERKKKKIGAADMLYTGVEADLKRLRGE